MNKQLIRNTEYEGERPLFATRGLRLENVRILPGESALKECSNIEAVGCEFSGKYPFWHNDGLLLENCVFREGARAAIWYSRNLCMSDTLVEAPKMFRDLEGVTVDKTRFAHAAETLWYCRLVQLSNVEIDEGDYLLLHGEEIRIDRLRLHGNYAFQYCRNVEIRNAEIHSKDAFWNTENVSVYDSTLDGEYLGWHSRNLRLVNCHISGTQPLCYAHNLVMENCTMDATADLAFEYSTLQADVRGCIHSVKNPTSGRIVADDYGAVIRDAQVKAPGNCSVETRKERPVRVA